MTVHGPLRLPPALRRRAAAAFAGGVLALGLTGCGGAAPGLKADAAVQLQQRVLAVTEAAAGSDPAGALTSLEQLAADLDAAAADGHVSFKRHQSITASVAAVRADLRATLAAKAEAAAATKAANPVPAPTPAAVVPAPAAVVPAPAPASGDTAWGNPGKDNADEDNDDAKGSAKDKD